MQDRSVYHVKRARNIPFDLNGNPNKAFWIGANMLTDFIFPWEDKPAPYTSFKAVYDDQRFYFFFEVIDEDIVLVDNFTDKRDATKEDRVELFFSPTEDIATYYCMEIDPLGRAYDFKAKYYREMDRTWSWPGLELKGIVTGNRYVVEGALPMDSFRELDMQPEKGIIAGIYRAEFSRENEGIKQEWVSWVDPKTEKPDFHVPSSFGRFIFEGL